MLIQRRPDALRLIRQHDHALAAGRMAEAWPGAELSLELLLATALHDAPWQEADGRPRLDPASGLPHDFVSYPREEKYRFLGRGIDDLQKIHPRVGLLVSLHHESFLGEKELPGWRESEAARRERLSRRPGVSLERAEADLALLQLFDNLSLFLCLTPPGSDPDSVPPWLRNEGLYAVPGEGPVLQREWLAPDVLAVRPFPFAGDVELEVPYRDLPSGPFPDRKALEGSWYEAPVRVWRATVVAGS